jgi:uncharacterized protein (DUF1778 family)
MIYKEVGDYMAVSKKQQQSVSKYVKNNYDRIEIKVKKGEKDRIRSAAAINGQSVNGFIIGAVEEAVDDALGTSREGGEASD